MPAITMLNPEALGKPLGQYSQIARVKAGDLVFIAGQVAADKEGRVVGAGDFDAQCRQVFGNIRTALQTVGAGWADVAQFTTYLVDADDIAKFMQFRLIHC
jgi:enamine deaminase RidA (YjgF/YER057c/UK114 family)